MCSSFKWWSAKRPILIMLPGFISRSTILKMKHRLGSSILGTMRMWMFVSQLLVDDGRLVVVAVVVVISVIGSSWSLVELRQVDVDVVAMGRISVIVKVISEKWKWVMQFILLWFIYYTMCDLSTPLKGNGTTHAAAHIHQILYIESISQSYDFRLTNKCVCLCVCPYTDLRGVKHEIINKEAHLTLCYNMRCTWVAGGKACSKTWSFFSTCILCMITCDPALG